MKEHYVSYDCAVKLKDLGFDWKCYYYYNSAKRLVESTTFSRTFRASDYWHNFNEYDRNSHSQPITPEYSAPRLDQAQAWLREVKGIFVYTKPILRSVGDEELQDFKFILKGYRFHVIKLDNAYHSTSYDYPTDEQALSAGIDAALELLTDKD